jgi:hypothetical protein
VHRSRLDIPLPWLRLAQEVHRESYASPSQLFQHRMRVDNGAINDEIGSDAIERTNTISSGCSDVLPKSGIECEVSRG